MGVFTKSKRFGSGVGYSSSGSMYNPPSLSYKGLSRPSANLSQRWGKSVRFASPEAKNDDNVGPGQYPVGADKHGPASAVGGQFGKAKRFSKERNVETPGPYDLPQGFRNARTGGIAKQTRFKDGEAAVSPGPTKYYCLPRPNTCGATFGRGARFAKERRSLTPGPYNLDNAPRPQSQAGRFGRGKRFADPGNDQSRPNTASSYLRPQSSLSNAGGGRFSRGSRFPKAITYSMGSSLASAWNPQTFASVGNSRLNVNASSRFGTSKRFSEERGEELGPGPGTAIPGIRPSTGGGGGRFSKSNRWSSAKVDTSPGPTAYGGSKPQGVVGSSMGKATRFEADTKDGDGPKSHYNPPGIGASKGGIAWKPPSVHSGGGGKKGNKKGNKEGPGFIDPPHAMAKSASARFGTASRFEVRGSKPKAK